MRKTGKRFLTGILCAAMAAGMLSGCGSSGSNETSAAGATAGTAQTEAGSQADTGAIAGVGPQSEDAALKLAVTTGDGSTTDDKIPTPWYNRIFSTNLMFRSLFATDSHLTAVNPDLAESYEVSDDGLTYTIVLKDGLKWSDGEELTSEDVLFSIETALKAATINSIYTSAFNKISEMSADGTVITLKLSAPYSDLPKVLTQFAILPEHCLSQADPLKLEADGFWTNPVTSGMYALEELSVGNYFTLKVNEHYEGTAPKIQKVINYFVSDYMTAAKAGNTDYMFTNAADQVAALEEGY